MSIYLFYKITSSKYKGWSEQKTEKQKEKKNLRNKQKGGHKEK